MTPFSATSVEKSLYLSSHLISLFPPPPKKGKHKRGRGSQKNKVGAIKKELEIKVHKQNIFMLAKGGLS